MSGTYVTAVESLELMLLQLKSGTDVTEIEGQELMLLQLKV